MTAKLDAYDSCIITPMIDVNLEKRIIDLAMNQPQLAMPYLTLGRQMGVNDERLAKYVKRLKASGKLPESFMPRRPTGQPRKPIHYHTIVLAEFKKELKKIQNNGVGVISIPKIRKIIRDKEREVLSMTISSG